MWILARIIAACVGFAARYLHHLVPRKPAGELNKQPYFEKVRKTKHGAVTGFRVGAALKSRVLFNVHLETETDRYFKSVGLSTEFQSEDEHFDRMVYITCDHPFLEQLLRNDPRLRGALLKILENGASRIFTDGEVLWIDREAQREVLEGDIEQVQKLRELLVGLDSELPSRFSDPFLRRALFVEALCWSILGYGWTTVAEYVFEKTPLHLNGDSVLWMGMFAAIALFLGIYALVFLLLKGSSRGHRVIIGGGILLLIGIPLAGVQLVSDLNCGLDMSEPKVETRRIVDSYKKLHRGPKGRRYYTYHLILHRLEGDYPVPADLSVDSYLFSQARKGEDLYLTISPGWLGLPWYKEVSLSPPAGY